MKVFSFILFLLLTAHIAASQDVKSLRVGLVRALNSKPYADSLYLHLKSAPHQTPLTVAFTGSARALQAKHAWNPFTKMSYVADAEKLFTQAVQKEPNSIEIRFLRFSVEHFVPGFLGYSKNLANDRDMMIELLHKRQYGSADNATVEALIKFLLDSNRCTPQQVDFLHKQLKELA